MVNEKYNGHKRFIKHITVVLIILIIGTSLNGCYSKKADSQERFIVFKNDSYTYAQAYLVYLNLQTLYNEKYANDYSNDFWKVPLFEDEKMCFDEYVKEYVFYNELLLLYSLNELPKTDVSLTQEEEESIIKQSAKYHEALQDFLQNEENTIQITQDDIQKIMKHYMVAQKKIENVLSDVRIEVSDEEARVVKAYRYATKDLAQAKRFHEKVLSGQDFYAIAKNESITTNLEYYISANSDAPKVFKEAVLKLDQGECSSIVDYYSVYYVFFVVDMKDELHSQKNKEELLHKKRIEFYTEQCYSLLEKSPIELNKELYDTIEFHYNDFKELISGIAISE